MASGLAQDSAKPKTSASQPPQVGDVAPTFTLQMLDSDKKVDLASFRGKRPVVLFFGSYT